MENVKRNIISFWLTHVFLRRIGKRYPDYFYEWMKDLTDDKRAIDIMVLRYSMTEPYSFKEIAYVKGMAIRRVFEKHKKVIDRIICGV